MNDKAIEDFIMKHVRLIEVNPEALSQALERAGKFLIAESVLTSLLKETEVSLTKTTSIERATFAQCIDESVAANITKQKADAEANPTYAEAREQHEVLEAKRKYLKNYIEIFRNAHVLYRQQSNIKE